MLSSNPGTGAPDQASIADLILAPLRHDAQIEKVIESAAVAARGSCAPGTGRQQGGELLDLVRKNDEPGEVIPPETPTTWTPQPDRPHRLGLVRPESSQAYGRALQRKPVDLRDARAPFIRAQ